MRSHISHRFHRKIARPFNWRFRHTSPVTCICRSRIKSFPIYLSVPVTGPGPRARPVSASQVRWLFYTFANHIASAAQRRPHPLSAHSQPHSRVASAPKAPASTSSSGSSPRIPHSLRRADWVCFTSGTMPRAITVAQFAGFVGCA
jgi:hypothetical protein